MIRLSVMVGLALALGTAAGCTRFGGKRNDSAKGPEAGVPVVVALAERGTMAQTLTVTGTIKAGQQADVGVQISARVLEVKVREGDTVQAGQVLVTLDEAQVKSRVRQARAGAEAAAARLAAAKRRLEVLEEGARPEEKAIARSRLEQAESALRTAEADLERLRGRYEAGAISKQQLDGAQTAYDTARTNRDSARQSLELMEKGARPEEIEAGRKDVEAAAAGLEQARGMLAEAEELLGYTLIRSPLTGIVYERHVEPGEITSTGGGDPLLRLADLSRVYYEATVPERVALRVKPGQRVDVIV
ncbi:MAG TPA: efflux RND transporter periplasmic adaptor subunit, partial [Armatimonadota bacterium]|nr:efflux RND transporter periplasmic adaptor subunit [Armatimonadota bacterium]